MAGAGRMENGFKNMTDPFASLRRHGVRALLAGVLLAAAATAGAGTPFGDWSEAFAADWVRLSPERATLAQYFSGEEQAALDRQLTPITPTQRERRAALARLDLFATSSLAP
jgi:hypothetical protein